MDIGQAKHHYIQNYNPLRALRENLCALCVKTKRSIEARIMNEQWIMNNG
jgi:hypothetical protein